MAHAILSKTLTEKDLLFHTGKLRKYLCEMVWLQPNVKKQKPRKWVRYELPNPNDMWHTDWSYDPFTGKNISVYIDDRTRLITCYGVFKKQTTENSLALLYSGIADCGKAKVGHD